MEAAEVKRVRIKLGLTQEELADVFGFSGPGSVGNIEIGCRSPSRLFARMLRLLDSLPQKKAQELLRQLQRSGDEKYEARSRVSAPEREN